MNRFKIILLLIEIGFCNIAKPQSTHTIPYDKIKNYINKHFTEWENTINKAETYDTVAIAKYETIYYQAVGIYANPIFNSENKNAQYIYDKQSETMQIKFKSFPEIYVTVPNSEASNFILQKENITFYNTRYSFVNNHYFIVSTQIMLPDKNNKYKNYKYYFNNAISYQFQSQIIKSNLIPSINFSPIGYKNQIMGFRNLEKGIDTNSTKKNEIKKDTIIQNKAILETQKNKDIPDLNNPNNDSLNALQNKIYILEELLADAVAMQNFLLADELKKQINKIKNTYPQITYSNPNHINPAINNIKLEEIKQNNNNTQFGLQSNNQNNAKPEKENIKKARYSIVMGANLTMPSPSMFLVPFSLDHGALANIEYYYYPGFNPAFGFNGHFKISKKWSFIPELWFNISSYSLEMTGGAYSSITASTFDARDKTIEYDIKIPLNLAYQIGNKGFYMCAGPSPLTKVFWKSKAVGGSSTGSDVDYQNSGSDFRQRLNFNTGLLYHGKKILIGADFNFDLFGIDFPVANEVVRFNMLSFKLGYSL